MSVVVATNVYVVPTVVGAMAVKTDLVENYDVDDIVRAKAISQARIIQLVNTGQSIAGTSSFPANSLPAVLQSTETLD